MLGYIPGFIHEDDPRPAKEQLNANYAHGGGWFPMTGFIVVDRDSMKLKYPGDPAMTPLYSAKLREEEIYVYSHAWVVIVQKDGSWEMARMD
jgi:hypothetical protein